MGILAPDLQVKIATLVLKNPVMTASGTFGYGEEFGKFLDLSRLGAVIVKGLSLMPRIGNPPPRLAETASGLLNTIGLQNIGVRAFVAEKLPRLRRCAFPSLPISMGNTLKNMLMWPRSSLPQGG